MKIVDNIKNKSGVALIITILLMSLILFLSIYFLSISLIEKKISHSQSWGVKTYYLAEAGIAEMVWRLKNNITYKNNFETNTNWTETFTRNNPFGPNSGSYTVTIANSSKAHGEIIATGSIDIGVDKTSQRIIKAQAYRAIGSGGAAIAENAGYADGNIDISRSKVNFYDGSAHANINFIVNAFSTVEIDTDLKVVGNFIKSWNSTVNIAGDLYALGEPLGPATEIEMPAVDFDSDDSGSYKNIANVVYSENDFEDLMWANQNLVLNNDITYVEGDVELRGGQNLTVNGLLVVERDFKVGNNNCWDGRCGNSSLTVNHVEGEPSGVLAKRKINFEDWSGDVNVDGIIYASNQINILSFPVGQDSNFNGGLIGHKLTITSAWQTINIIRNEEILISSLGITEFSPVITVEHWEEEY